MLVTKFNNIDIANVEERIKEYSKILETLFQNFFLLLNDKLRLKTQYFLFYKKTLQVV